MIRNEFENDYGPCCACEGTEHVRNIMMLHFKAPVPGTGWGCVVCNLPFDGAVAVLCDRCLEIQAGLRFAVNGFAADKKRIPYEDLRGVHEHDMKFHPEAIEVDGEEFDQG